MLRMKNFNILPTFRGGFTKHQYINGADFLRGAWTVYRFKRGAGEEAGGGVFGGGWYPDAHYEPWCFLFVVLVGAYLVWSYYQLKISSKFFNKIVVVNKRTPCRNSRKSNNT